MAIDSSAAHRFVDDPQASPRIVPRGATRPPHFLHIFPSFGVGGVPIRISFIINHFGERYRHSIVALDGCFDSKTRLDGALRVELLDPPQTGGGLPANVIRIRHQLRALRPDLLLTYNWGSVEWAFANALSPLCRHIHLESGFGPEEAEGQLRRRALFRRLALARAAHLVVPSHHLVELATTEWKIDPARIVLIANGVDYERFAAPPGVRRTNPFFPDDRAVVIGTVAPLRAEKNVARLIRAFAAIPRDLEARLLIAGDGPERSRLEALAAALGVGERTRFAGHIENMHEAYVWFDVFALSSDTEQMPNALIQAMAAGRPVAAVDVGDIKRIVSPENRLLIGPKTDETGLTRVLEQLIRDPAERSRLGLSNQLHARTHYDAERMFRAYEAVFEG